MSYAIRHPESIERLVVMNTAAFLPPPGKRIPIRLKIIRNFKQFANIAVLGFNLFAYSALFMASHKGLQTVSFIALELGTKKGVFSHSF